MLDLDICNIGFNPYPIYLDNYYTSMLDYSNSPLDIWKKKSMWDM